MKRPPSLDTVLLFIYGRGPVGVLPDGAELTVDRLVAKGLVVLDGGRWTLTQRGLSRAFDISAKIKED